MGGDSALLTLRPIGLCRAIRPITQCRDDTRRFLLIFLQRRRGSVPPSRDSLTASKRARLSAWAIACTSAVRNASYRPAAGTKINLDSLSAQVGTSVAAEFHAGAVLEIIRRMQDYVRSLVEALEDLCLRSVTVADFHGKKSSSSVFNRKHIPLLPNAE